MILYQDSNFGLSKLVEDQIFESVSKSKSCQLGRAHSQIHKHQNPLMRENLILDGSLILRALRVVEEK